MLLSNTITEAFIRFRFDNDAITNPEHCNFPMQYDIWHYAVVYRNDLFRIRNYFPCHSGSYPKIRPCKDDK